MYHHLNSTKKPYIGRSISEIIRSSPESVVINFTDGLKTELSVHGDCCSQSIFYDIVIPEECKGSEIIDIDESSDNNDQWEDSKNQERINFEKLILEKADLVSPGFSEYTDCLRIWDVIIKTKAGDILIRHINDSNGYYDGCTDYKDL